MCMALIDTGRTFILGGTWVVTGDVPAGKEEDRGCIETSRGAERVHGRKPSNGKGSNGSWRAERAGSKGKKVEGVQMTNAMEGIGEQDTKGFAKTKGTGGR